MTNSTKEPKYFYSKVQTAFSLAPFFMPIFQFVLVFGILILCKIERKRGKQMISVDPIRDEQKIQTMKSYLKGKNLRDYALFVVG